MNNTPSASEEIEKALLGLQPHQNFSELVDPKLNTVPHFHLETQSRLQAWAWGMGIAKMAKPGRVDVLAILDWLVSQDPVHDAFAVGYIRAISRHIREVRGVKYAV